MGQNALTQSECRIFKSTISPEQINEPVYFLACWYKFTKIIWKKKKKVDQIFLVECGQK